MNITEAKVRVGEELVRCAGLIARDGIITKSRVWLEDKKFNECETDGAAAYIQGEILVLTEGMADDDGLVVVFTAECKKGAVDKDALEDEIRGFGGAAEELAAKLDEAESATEYLAERIKSADIEAKQMMEDFEREMKKMRRGAIIFAAVVFTIAIAIVVVSMVF